ncbi:hypothetical protein QQ045_030093 [Rhodiola kirilowii]
MNLTLPLILTLFTLSIPAIAQQIPSNATVYEILPLFGLPSGLLPASVQSYTFNSEDGRFVVVLPKPCYIQFDYLVYYDDTITGVLKYGSITVLEGIQVRRFWVWFGVDEIRVDLPPSDSIYFQVGVISKRLDVDQFKTVRSCGDDGVELGCGDDGGKLKKILAQSISGAAEVELLLTE